MVKKKTARKKRKMPNRADPDVLTPAEENACRYYMENDGDQSAAYRKAFHKRCKSWKPQTIHVRASELFKLGKVQVRLAELTALMKKETEASVENIVREAARISFSDARKLFDNEGNLLHPSQWDDEIAGAVSSIKVHVDKVTTDVEDNEAETKTTTTRVETSTREIKFWDKNAALEKLFKKLGLYKEDNQQKRPVFERMTPETQDMLIEKLYAINERNGDRGASRVAGESGSNRRLDS